MASESGTIIAKVDGAIGGVVIDNPARRNAVSFAMWQAIPKAVDTLATDDAVRVIVVSGAGGKAFSAGNDISEFGQLRATKEGVAKYDDATGRAYRALKEVEKPTIAMIQGFCVGGGLEVSQLCDLQIASDDARFAVTPARLGLGYKLADVQLLVDAVGPKHAKEILFTARMFDAEEALRMGLVHQVAPASEIQERVDETAKAVAANAPLSVKAAKLIVAEAVKDAAGRDEDLCQRLVEACLMSADYKEGQRAFAEKRKPEFKGR